MSIRRRLIKDRIDLTFVFTSRGTGYKITVIDNDTDKEVKLDDLSSEAERYYIAQLVQLTKEKLMRKSVITA